uniref:Uncharacterized protein n=1 Tax=viral metagenome TaxID=1070528 RepID=A0A6C0B1P6_9ZZZZ
MPRFLACSNSRVRIRSGGIFCHSFSYGEYDTLKEAMTRLNEVAENAFYGGDEETIKYFVNELAPPGIYPVVAKTYPLS